MSKNKSNDLIYSQEVFQLTRQGQQPKQMMNNEHRKIKKQMYQGRQKKSTNYPKIIVFIVLVGLTMILFTGNNSNTKNNKKYKGKDISKLSQPQKIQLAIDSFIKKSRYYDISHYTKQQFKDGTVNYILNGTKKTQKISKQPREILQIKRTNSQLQQILSKMKSRQGKTQRAQFTKQLQDNHPNLIQNAYFYFQLNNRPNYRDFIQAQFYRYDQIYQISKYSNQLPLCIVIVGKNNYATIQKLYQSIYHQNYTNYKIIHIDDNSNDNTSDKLLQYINNRKNIKQRITFISQKYQRNALYNRNYGNSYCDDHDIIVDIDADDWIIGRQVFQLVNTIYQKSNILQNNNNIQQQLWCVYFTNIACCPMINLYSNVQQNYIKAQTYRSQAPWRTTQLRTYLKLLYNKIDINDYYDPLMNRNKQMYVQSYDVFIQSPMLEMAAPKHIKFIDQFVYYYTGSPTNNVYTQLSYSLVVARTLPPYQMLKSLQDKAEKNYNFKPNQKLMFQLRQRKSQIIQKRYALQLKFQQLMQVNLSKNNNKISHNINNNNNNISSPSLQYEIESKQVFNKQNQGKIFGQSPQFAINITKIGQTNRKPNFNYSAHGIQTRIQVGSNFDYVNISRVVNFTQLQIKLFNSLSYQLLTFTKYPQLSSPSLLQFTQLKSIQQYEQYTTKIQTKDSLGLTINILQLYLATRLAMPYIDKLTLQMQYYYYNKKYNISQYIQQHPICIFSSGYNVYKNRRYRNLFISIQRMNYTNYKLIWVDDNSQDNSSYNIYKYINKHHSKLKDKIKIIHNLQHIGILANMHIYIKKYCNTQDIVLIVDSDDALIGTQTFKLLNKIYNSNNNYLFVHTRFIMTTDTIDRYQIGPQSAIINISTQQYRAMTDKWTTSHLRTFKKSVMDAVPLQHFIQYHYNKSTGLAYPKYYGSSADRFQVYSHIQICGNQRIYFLPQYLYNYDYIPPQTCYRNHQIYDQYKSRIKIPLQILKDGENRAKIVQNYQTPMNLLAKLKQIYPQYQQCIKQKNNK